MVAFNKHMDGHRCCLVVIDGWGVSEDEKNSVGDAIRHAKTPVMTSLIKQHPNTLLTAHGRAVGLPEGLMGNSEVGHLNIGAGRVVYQDIVRIDLAIEQKTLSTNPVLQEAWKKAHSTTGRIHFIGLVSDGGVHSHINHLKALLNYAQEARIPSIFIHAITDGRDTSPTSAIGYLDDLQLFLAQRNSSATLATVVGRYYAMDRDKRWERTKIAFDALVTGSGEGCPNSASLTSLLKSKYQQGETDEFFKPIIVNSAGRIKNDDVIIFFNFRSDRMRQITAALGGLLADFQPPIGLSINCMTRYREDFPFPILSPPQQLNNVLAEWISHQGLRQYHVAETEKYAHVTFFFNGGREVKFAGEERLMVPSPKVATYDQQPAMSVHEVAAAVVAGIHYKEQADDKKEKYALVMCNLAPPDMVGHTGHFQETIKAVEATDAAIGMIYDACRQTNTILIVTADHGNAEKMLSDDGSQPHTAHTCAPVPLIICLPNAKADVKLQTGALCDVAPTILDLMNLPIPPEMTGHSLVTKRNS